MRCEVITQPGKFYTLKAARSSRVSTVLIQIINPNIMMTEIRCNQESERSGC
jgi:hypothetical protein